MNEDINFLANDTIFNYRVAVIIRHNDNILVRKIPRLPIIP